MTAHDTTRRDARLVRPHTRSRASFQSCHNAMRIADARAVRPYEWNAIDRELVGTTHGLKVEVQENITSLKKVVYE